jgi:hypothetical protein
LEGDVSRPDRTAEGIAAMSELLAAACCCGPNLVWEAIRCPTIANPAAPPIVYIPASADLAGLGVVVLLTVEWGDQCYSVNTRQVGIPIGDVPPALLAIVDVVVGTDCVVCELPACQECTPCSALLAWFANVAVETHHDDGKITLWQWTANGMVNKFSAVGQPDPAVCLWSPLKQGGPQNLPWSGTLGIFTQSAQGGVFQDSCSVTNEIAFSIAGGLACVPFVRGDPFSPPTMPTDTMWVTTCSPLPSSICQSGVHPCGGLCFAGQRAVRVVYPRVPGCFETVSPVWASALNPVTGQPECWAPVIAGTSVCYLASEGTTTYITPEVNWA